MRRSRRRLRRRFTSAVQRRSPRLRRASLGLLLAVVALISSGAHVGGPIAKERAFRPVEEPELGGPIPGRGEPAAYVWRATWLHASPDGLPLKRVAARTEFGSRRVLSIVDRRGPWVGVIAAELRNGQVGWLDARRFTRLLRVSHTIDVDLSERRAVVRRLGRQVKTFRVAVGTPNTPTPTGRFAVTDKLLTGQPSGPYGCCAVALTAHQPKVPQGWGGGDRVAIHATPSPGSIGQAASLGCLRADTKVMRRLIKEIPLGAPVQVRR